MVRRGTTWTAAPRQRVTVKCPVKDCGEPLSVTWCKLSDTDRCERINQTENVQQNDKRVKDKLVSFLTFKRISIHNDGLYGCSLKGYKFEMISHTINISVSGRCFFIHQCQNVHLRWLQVLILYSLHRSTDSYHGVKQSVDTTGKNLYLLNYCGILYWKFVLLLNSKGDRLGVLILSKCFCRWVTECCWWWGSVLAALLLHLCWHSSSGHHTDSVYPPEFSWQET